MKTIRSENQNAFLGGNRGMFNPGREFECEAREYDKGGPSRYFQTIKETNQQIEGNPMIDFKIADIQQFISTVADNVYTGIFADPPYGLNFNNQKWDYELPSIKVYQELLRVARPGAYMLMFGSPRTYHRLASRIEDAGWEIRTCLLWLYGQGFPKGLNIGKKLPEFNGYNTQLKPAFEPVVLAQKPLDGGFVQNAEKWGCGGLNVGETRVGTEERPEKPSKEREKLGTTYYRPTGGGMLSPGGIAVYSGGVGRYPSNVIIDEQIAADLDANNPYTKSQSSITKRGHVINNGRTMSPFQNKMDMEGGYDDDGGPSRFYYVAKTSTTERNEGCVTRTNNHPTLKPIALNRYLATLIMPPKERQLLVPFSGAGSEVIGAALAGWDHILGVDNNEEYVMIARERLDHHMNKLKVASPQESPLDQQIDQVVTQATDEETLVTPS